MRPIDVHGVPMRSPSVGVRALGLPAPARLNTLVLLRACDIVRHCMTPEELERWFPAVPPPSAADTMELPMVEVDTLAPPTADMPPWGIHLLETVYGGECAELLYDLIALLIEHQGRALVPALGATLNMPGPDLRALIAYMGARINPTEGFPALGYDADGETVVMILTALAAQYEVNLRRFRVFRPGGRSVVFELPFDPSEAERKALEHLARYQRLSEAELSRLCGTRRIGGLMQLLMERLTLAGWNALAEEAAGDEGRIYAFRDEKL